MAELNTKIVQIDVKMRQKDVITDLKNIRKELTGVQKEIKEATKSQTQFSEEGREALKRLKNLYKDLVDEEEILLKENANLVIQQDKAKLSLEATATSTQKVSQSMVMAKRESGSFSSAFNNMGRSLTYSRGMLGEIGMVIGDLPNQFRLAAMGFKSFSSALTASSFVNAIGAIAGLAFQFGVLVNALFRSKDATETANKSIGTLQPTMKALAEQAGKTSLSFAQMIDLMYTTMKLSKEQSKITSMLSERANKITELAKVNHDLAEAMRIVNDYSGREKDAIMAGIKYNRERAKTLQQEIDSLDKVGAQTVKYTKTLQDEVQQINNTSKETITHTNAIKDNTKEKEKNKKETEDLSLEYAKLADALHESGVKLTSEQNVILKNAIKNHQDWQAILKTFVDEATQKKITEDAEAMAKKVGEAVLKQTEIYKAKLEDSISQSISLIGNWVNYFSQQQTEEFQKQETALDEAFKNGQMAYGQYIQEKNSLDEKAKKERLKYVITSAILERGNATFKIVMSTLTAISEAMAISPLTLGEPMASWAKAIGAINTALVWAQPLPKFKEGGEVGGKKHEEGGTMVEAEKGEYIVKASAYNANKGVVQAINSGSYSDDVQKSQDTFNNLLEAISQLKIYTAITDVNEAQQNYTEMTTFAKE